MQEPLFFIMYWIKNDDGSVERKISPTSYKNEVFVDSAAASRCTKELQGSMLGATMQRCDRAWHTLALCTQLGMLWYVQAACALA